MNRSYDSESEKVYIPRWILILFLGMMVQGLVIVFAAGTLYNKVTELERRVGGMEQQLLILIRR